MVLSIDSSNTSKGFTLQVLTHSDSLAATQDVKSGAFSFHPWEKKVKSHIRALVSITREKEIASPKLTAPQSPKVSTGSGIPICASTMSN